MAVEVREHGEHVMHAPPPRRTGIRRFTGPGWLRVLWLVPLSFGLATAFVIGARAALDYRPLWNLQVLIVAWTVIVPLGFLIGDRGLRLLGATSPGARRCPRTTPATAPSRGGTTSASTPITR